MIKNKKRYKRGGFILINKPAGITSHDVVDKLRKITKIQKIGHSGTLDPFAEGLLILAIGGEFTKKLSDFQKMDKEYIATLKLGEISDTFDLEGKILRVNFQGIPPKSEIKKVLSAFWGKIEQIPPIFSAKKIKGRKSYELARKGISVNLEPQKVNIYKISILDYSFPHLKLKIKCSSGTYIRSLAFDIGQKLGCGAYLSALARSRIGKFSLKDAVLLSDLNSQNWENYLFYP